MTRRIGPARMQDLDNPKVSFNTYIRVETKKRLVEFVDTVNNADPIYIQPVALTWPKTYSAIVDEAILNWLAEHPLKSRNTPKPKHAILKEDHPSEKPDFKPRPARKAIIERKADKI